jgi:hypothetical protein
MAKLHHLESHDTQKLTGANDFRLVDVLLGVQARYQDRGTARDCDHISIRFGVALCPCTSRPNVHLLYPKWLHMLSAGNQ